MYSDFLESPSKGCTSFNDPFQAYDMAEMNEISNQTNLDYIFDSYYSTRVSQYDTGFELPEDCKNMSFSELFDQELFSTQENKDCKITIKIEKEEPLTSCFSCDDSQDIPNNHSLVQIENNIPISSTLSKNLVSKKGINRTIIKNNDKCDVLHLMNNPFSESENSEKHQELTQPKTLVIKEEPKDITNSIIDQQIFENQKSTSFSTANFQITSDNSSVKNKDNVLSPKSSTPKHQCINWTSIETINNCDYKDLVYNSFKPKNIVYDKNPIKLITPILKEEPINNNDIKQNMNGMIYTPYNSDGLQSTNISHSLKQNDDLSSLSDMSTLKHPGINSVSIKTLENRHVEDLKYKLFCKKDDTGIGQVPVNIELPTVKCKSNTIIDKNIIDTKTIKCYPVNNSLNTSDCHKFIKVEIVKNGLLSSLSNNLTKQNQDINKTSVKIVKSSDNIKQLINKPCKIITSSGIDQTLFKVQTPIVKYESVNHCKVLSSAPKSLVLSHQGIKTSIKIIKSHNIAQLTKNSFGKTQNVNIDQSSMKVITPLIKCEPKYDSDTTIKDKTVDIIPFSSNVDLQSITDDQCFIKIGNSCESSSSKSSPRHCGTINNFITISENNNGKNSIHKPSWKSENSDIDQLSVKVVTPVAKQQPEEITDTIKQNIIASEKTPCYSGDNSPGAIHSDSITKHKKDFITALSESSTLKHHVTKRTSINTTENQDVKDFMKKCVHEVEVQGDDQTKEIKKEVEELSIDQINEIKNELENQDTNYFVKEKGTVKKELNGDDSNVLYNINLNNTDIEDQVVIKKEHNENNDANSLVCTVENEKKKITWEEFRAKREKMGLLMMPMRNEDLATDFIQTENYKLEAIKEEFDRNTAAHFINLKRQIEDIEDTNDTVSKEANNKEDQELQNKRRKIEYIQKLLPSSFASEIAKTSSLMKGVLVEDNENHITSDYSIISTDKTQKKYDDSYEDSGYFKKDDRFQKKSFQTRVHSSHCNPPRFNYPAKSSRSSSVSSNPDNCYNRNKIDATQKVGQNARNIIQRPKEQKRVVYVGQIPIRYGKRYLHTRFKEFGSIQSLTLHRKPDFRVYYAFVTYSDKTEAERAINHGNDNKAQVQLDIRYGERKQTQTPYYDLDDEWLTDWYGYNPQPVAVVRQSQNLERASFEEELQEFYKLAQIKKLNQKSPQIS